MDDDSCVMKYIEIVPLEGCSDATDEPVTVKVLVVCISLMCETWLIKYLVHDLFLVRLSTLLFSRN